jgi:hypothetical protein
LPSILQVGLFGFFYLSYLICFPIQTIVYQNS